MGILDRIVRRTVSNTVSNVISDAIYDSTSGIREEVRDKVDEETHKLKMAALKKAILVYLEIITKNFNGDELEKQAVIDSINHLVDQIDQGYDEQYMIKTINDTTNMLYKYMGKPETACSTDFPTAQNEFMVALKEMSERSQNQIQTN